MNIQDRTEELKRINLAIDIISAIYKADLTTVTTFHILGRTLSKLIECKTLIEKEETNNGNLQCINKNCS